MRAIKQPIERLSESEIASLRSEMLNAERLLAERAAASPRVKELKSQLDRKRQHQPPQNTD
jgi:hypothetical protein